MLGEPSPQISHHAAFFPGIIGPLSSLFENWGTVVFFVIREIDCPPRSDILYSTGASSNQNAS